MPDCTPIIDALRWTLSTSAPLRVVTHPHGSAAYAVASLIREGDRLSVLDAVAGALQSPAGRQRHVAVRILRHLAVALDDGHTLGWLPDLIADLRVAVLAPVTHG